jgi:hypothetical protein
MTWSFPSPAVAFKAFDMGNRGVVTLGDMAAAIKDITSTVSTRLDLPLAPPPPNGPLTLVLGIR